MYYHCNASLWNRIRRINKDRQPNGWCSLYKATKVNEHPLTSIILKFLNLSGCKFIVNSAQFSFFAQLFLLDISRTIGCSLQFFHRSFFPSCNEQKKKRKLEKSLEFPISTTIQYPNFNYFFENTSFYSTISIFNYFNFCFEFNISTLIIIESKKKFFHLWIKFFDAREWHLWSYLTHAFIIIKKNKYSFIRKLSYLKHHISLNSNIITVYSIFIDDLN